MSSPEAPTASSAPDEKRQPRQSRLVKGSLGCQRLGRFDVTIRNVSETGIGGQGPHSLNIGERMTVFLPGHEPMLGTVRWVSGNRFGLETDKPVETMRLRASHGDDLRTAPGVAESGIGTSGEIASSYPIAEKYLFSTW
ncbi:PilZ domain-containing protein [Sphingopyxis sp.]|uniref:PilZ domain-containing protein n=1 Tax=Sphingopyxis sp. TaxID=1908224 RepID=UPI0035ADBF15